MTATIPPPPAQSVIPDAVAIRARLQQVRAEARVLAGILRAMEGYTPAARTATADGVAIQVRQEVTRAG